MKVAKAYQRIYLIFRGFLSGNASPGKSKVQVFDTPQIVNCFKVESDAALLSVDLTGNLIMVEKLVLGEIWTGDLPIFNLVVVAIPN